MHMFVIFNVNFGHDSSINNKYQIMKILIFIYHLITVINKKHLDVMIKGDSSSSSIDFSSSSWYSYDSHESSNSDDCDPNKICPICITKISNRSDYGKILIIGEKQYKYHVTCLLKWVNSRGISIITRQAISSFNVYNHKNKFIRYERIRK